MFHYTIAKTEVFRTIFERKGCEIKVVYYSGQVVFEEKSLVFFSS